MNGRGFKDNADWARKESLPRRILFQAIRIILVVFFLYLTYLGFLWRSTSSPPKKKPPPLPAGPAQRSAPSAER